MFLNNFENQNYVWYVKDHLLNTSLHVFSRNLVSAMSTHLLMNNVPAKLIKLRRRINLVQFILYVQMQLHLVKFMIATNIFETGAINFG